MSKWASFKSRTQLGDLGLLDGWQSKITINQLKFVKHCLVRDRRDIFIEFNWKRIDPFRRWLKSLRVHVYTYIHLIELTMNWFRWMGRAGHNKRREQTQKFHSSFNPYEVERQQTADRKAFLFKLSEIIELHFTLREFQLCNVIWMRTRSDVKMLNMCVTSLSDNWSIYEAIRNQLVELWECIALKWKSP